jgi:type IV secretory pathway TraG/TraD family ATPase VirD4
MQRGFIKTLLHYGVIQFGLAAFLIHLFYPLLCSTLWEAFFGDARDLLHLRDEVSLNLFTLVLIALWTLFYFIYLREVRYRDKTGRSFGSDHRKYGYSWHELVEYFKDADDKRIRKEELPDGNWKTSEGIILGHVGGKLVKRDSDGVGNLALFSLPGGGKTTSQIIPTAMRFKGSVLCIDIKGDVLNWIRKHIKRKIKIFAPDNAKISCHFDPLGGIKTMNITERKAFIENLGFALIPDEPGDNSKFFVDGGRDFWNGVSLYMLAQDINTSFMDIVDAILTEDPFTWIVRIKDSDVYEAKIFTDGYYQGNERNISGQWKKTCDAVRPFTNGALATLLQSADDAITPKTLDAGYDIYIEIPQDKIQMYAPVTTIIVQNFMTYFMGRPDSSTGVKIRPILMLLDEFPQLHFNIETLLSAMETLRSKKVSLFLAQQSLASLSRRYGEDGCREIIDNCAYISVMSAQDPKSRKFFQELIGTRKVLKVGKTDSSHGSGNSSNSRSVQEAREPVYQPEDFGNLNDKVVIVANGRYIEADKCKCYE